MAKKKQVTKNRVIRFRIDPETNKILIARSLHFFKGNISALLRHAILNFKRPKNDQDKER